MNTDAPPSEWPLLGSAEQRVREIQTKLHRWANDDPHRKFDDLYNLVCDPAFLLVAWDRVRGNKGARTAGVDGQSTYYVEAVRGVEGFLEELRAGLKARTFRPLPVRERMIPKPGTRKRRRLGIATVRDRVVQASLKLVLEPIFEAEFLPCSYGFRPKRRAHDAVAEVRHFTSRSYEWIVEGDIQACFDEISHPSLMDRLRGRIGDKRVLALVKAFLKAGILTEDGRHKDTQTGAPQGGILSPLLSNVALSVLDEYIAQAPGGPGCSPYGRVKRRRQGLPNYRLSRYADDWCLVVSGTKAHAEALREEIAGVLSTMGLRLSPEKTLITHIDDGLDFLGWRIQRRRKRGTSKQYVYTYPAKKALAAVTAKVKTTCWQNTNQPLEVLLYQLNSMLRGWTTYFKDGSSSATFGYLRIHVWQQVVRWQRRNIGMPLVHNSDAVTAEETGGPSTVTWCCSTRQRYTHSGTSTAEHASPHRGPASHENRSAVARGACGEPGASRDARRVRRAGRGNGPAERPVPRSGPTLPVRVRSLARPVGRP